MKQNKAAILQFPKLLTFLKHIISMGTKSTLHPLFEQNQ